MIFKRFKKIKKIKAKKLCIFFNDEFDFPLKKKNKWN